MLYDEKFFSDGDVGSTRSAKIIVPLLMEIFSPQSVLDLGCGTGSFIKIFQDLGVKHVLGVDNAIAETGLFHLDPSRLVAADLTHPIELGRRFDLVICLEVAEHLPPEDAETLVDTIIRHGDSVCFSAAIPQQEGVDHVNCQWPVYWSALFVDKGYIAVDALRAVLWNKEVVEWWYRQNTILYIKRERFRSGIKKKLASIAPRGPFPLSLVHPRHYEYKADARHNLAGQVQRTQAELALSGEELARVNMERDSLAGQVRRTLAELALGREELTRVSVERDALTGQLQQVQGELALRREDVDTILRSRSWRMTRPLRIAMDWIRERNGRDHAGPPLPPKQHQEAKASNDLPIAAKRECPPVAEMMSVKGISLIREILSSFVRANYGSLKRLLDILPKEVRSRLVHKVMDRFPELRPIAMSRQVVSAKGARNAVRLDVTSSDPGERVLVIEQRLPTPDMTSSSVRLQAMLEVIVDLGYKVTFISNSLIKDYNWLLNDPDKNIKKYERGLAALNIPIIYGAEVAVAHLSESGESYAYAILSLPQIMYDYSPLVRAYCPNAFLIYDMVDIHGLRYAREYTLKGGAALKANADYYNAIEAANIASSDKVIAITPDEAERIRLVSSKANVEIIPNLHEVKAIRGPFSARHGLMFIGHYLHSPNEDAVAYFVSEILPFITAEIPDIKFYVCGSCATGKINSLAGLNVQVVGYVEDPAEYFNKARVFVAPLRYGAGMKGKIGQSMSFGLPVVATTIGAEGMGLVHGQSALIADKPEEFARHVLRLYKDEALWSAISEQSRKHIKECFSKSAVRHAFVNLFAKERIAIK